MSFRFLLIIAMYSVMILKANKIFIFQDTWDTPVDFH